MTWQQFLTEKVLGECWKADGWFCQSCNEVKPPQKVTFHEYCDDCGDKLGVSVNRTFTNRNDLMDLYEQIWKDGKWIQFEEYSSDKWDKLYPYMMKTAKIISFTPWLFCLDGKDYEARCKMVSEFYGWGEGK